jgi:hypothetical protein
VNLMCCGQHHIIMLSSTCLRFLFRSADMIEPFPGRPMLACAVSEQPRTGVTVVVLSQATSANLKQRMTLLFDGEKTLSCPIIASLLQGFTMTVNPG